MEADISGALRHIKNGGRGWRAFEHRGRSMTKLDVIKVLEYGIRKGYKSTGEFSDSEVDDILKNKKAD